MRLMTRASLTSLLVTAVAAGCDGDVRLSTGVISVDGSAASTRASALVGTWRRLELVTDAWGVTHASESSWSFANDGSAALTVVARNLNAGWSDVTVRRAHWRTEGGVVVIEYLAPDAGALRLAWHVERGAGGETLFLGPLSYARVAA
jgi:hypothetical protein